MSYGINLKDQYRNVGCILKGTKPADLPVMQPTKFENGDQYEDRQRT